jgi:hypothetical protein
MLASFSNEIIRGSSLAEVRESEICMRMEQERILMKLSEIASYEMYNGSEP